MPLDDAVPRPRIGISSCLLGEEVRYDGAHKRHAFLTEELGRFVDWVPLCPEVEVGMGVPREPVRLVRGDAGPVRMVAVRTGRDWTDEMAAFARAAVGSLAGSRLAGYLLKASSPSCGPFRIKVYPEGDGAPTRDGAGLFAAELARTLPELPVDDEGRLNDGPLRENFFVRVFTRNRWLHGPSAVRTAGALVDFHARAKMLLLAHDPEAYQRLGRLVADPERNGLEGTLERYGEALMQVLRSPASPGRHVNVMQHLMGFLRDRLSSSDRGDILRVMDEYRAGIVPLITPLTLLRHHLRGVEHPWVHGQFYLAPYPSELGLRSFV